MQVLFKRMSINRSFGIEIEMNPNLTKKSIVKIIRESSNKPLRQSGWELTQNNNSYWHLKTDSSCGDPGWELATYKADSNKDLNDICNVAKNLHKAGAKTDSDTGLHIHIGIEDFDLEQVGIMMARWVKIENFILQSVRCHRRENYFCRPVSKHKKFRKKKFYSSDEFWNLIRPKRYGLFGNPQRRLALNMLNYAISVYRPHVNRNLKTVEFRFPEGTTCPIDIRNRTCLFLNFVENSKTASMPSDLTAVQDLNLFLEYFGLENSDNFIILSKPLNSLKLWLLNRLETHAESKKIKSQVLDKIKIVAS